MEETAEAIDQIIEQFGDQIWSDDFWKSFRSLVEGRAGEMWTVN